MEFLKELKIPSNSINKFGNVHIRIERDLSGKNGDRLFSFLQRLNKNISMNNNVETFKLGRAVKLDRFVKLIQMNADKLSEFNSSENGTEDTVEGANDETVPIVENPGKSRPRAKESNEDANVDNFNADEDFLNKYKRYIDDDKIFKLPLKESYFLNNRHMFTEDMKRMLERYLLANNDGDGGMSSCDAISSDSGFNPLIHQELIKQYLNSYSPYRGVLLYHGLGSGKTCTSIGIIEAMKTTKPKIFIMTTAALQENYKSQLKFCGSSLFNEDGKWKFVEYPSDKNEKDLFIKNVRSITNLPSKYMYSKSGVFLQEKESTDDEVGPRGSEELKELREQIDMMINSRFEFISYNGISMKRWKSKYKKKDNMNPFDNSVVIIDEGHNFVSRIVNKLNKKKHSISTELYVHLTTAENCRVIVLSGTPYINYPNELGVMFNLIGGCNLVIEMLCTNETNRSKENIDGIEEALGDLNNVDHLSYNNTTKVLQIMKNPYGFITTPDDKIIFDSRGEMTTRELYEEINIRLNTSGYKCYPLDSKPHHMLTKERGDLQDNMYNNIKVYNKFPDTEEEFNNIFVNRKTNGLKNRDYFRNKITGMVSYVGDKRELMPTIIQSNETNPDIFIKHIPMNDYVMTRYKEARSLESKIDQNSSNKKGDDQTSSYKIFSRAACNFVFPPEFEKPIPSHSLLKNLEEDDLEILNDKEMLDMSDGKYDNTDLEIKHGNNTKSTLNSKQKYQKEIQSLLDDMEKNADECFASDIQKDGLIKNIKDYISNPSTQGETEYGLKKYSPKFYAILENILDPAHSGLHLMYSNFRTLEGIGLFKIILDYYGYSEFKLKKISLAGNQSEYKIDIKNKFYQENDFRNGGEMRGRKFYALYTGKESDEEKEIIRNIYNSEFEKIPTSVKEDIYEKFGAHIQTGDTKKGVVPPNNLLGEIIKLGNLS